MDPENSTSLLDPQNLLHWALDLGYVKTAQDVLKEMLENAVDSITAEMTAEEAHNVLKVISPIPVTSCKDLWLSADVVHVYACNEFGREKSSGKSHHQRIFQVRFLVDNGFLVEYIGTKMLAHSSSLRLDHRFALGEGPLAGPPGARIF
jgi:hypothetical protein